MIIDMKKFLFVGAKEDLTDFFLRAQEEGIIEFIADRSHRGKSYPEEVKELSEAIKILRKQPKKEPFLKGEGLEQAHTVARQIHDLYREAEKLSEEMRMVESEISRVAPFGSFSFSDIDFIRREGKKAVQFFCVKTTKGHEIKDDAELFYVGTEYDLDYYIGIHDHPRAYPGMIEMLVERTAEELKHHLPFLEEALHQVEAELKGFAGHIDFLREALLEELDRYALDKAKSDVAYPVEGQVFSIEGWVPKVYVEELPSLIEGKALFFEPIVIEKEDKVPTCMINEKSSRIGEDLVRIYDIPSATDKDPSRWVLWAFTLFFAMIIADGGYGVLFLLLAFFLRTKFPDLQGLGKRFISLIFILSTSCIIWGVATASFFALDIGPLSPLGKLSIINRIAEKKADYHFNRKDAVYEEFVKEYPTLKQAKSGKELLLSEVEIKKGTTKRVVLGEFTSNILLEISLLIGIVHVCLGLFRYAGRNYANIGWILFAIGGYLYFPLTLKATTMLEFLGGVQKDFAGALGIQLIYGGIAFALISALIQKKWKGVFEIMQVVTIFADILSYLRLYALSLASSIMAQSFNDMGIALGLFVGAIVILVGHAINITLGIMGGVIHGLRLNFIEWYHHCFEGEGRLFNPLRKLNLKWKEE